MQQFGIDKIKEEVKCSQFLKKSRGAEMYVCPFCGSGTGKSKTGALKVYRDSNRWKCHACNESGDVLDLIQKVYGMDFTGALEKAAEIAGVQYGPGTRLEGRTGDFLAKGVQKHHKEAKVKNTANYTAYYEACKKNLTDERAISYLTARGISEEIARAAGLGFDPEADPANAPGAAVGEKKLHPVPRIIIPTTQAHYVARSIDPNTEKCYQKLNPNREKGAGEPGIFGLDTIYRQPWQAVFVVEGAFDALSLMEIGHQAIAINSTSNTEKLIAQLQRKPAPDGTAFIVAFDNDSDEKTAARTREAAEGLTAHLNELGYKSMQADITGAYKDINDAINGDRAVLEQLAAKAVKEAMPTYLDDFFEKVQGETYKPHKTGLAFFDELMSGGVEDQQLIILMAAPGTGKTTLCQQLAEEMAAHHKPVIYLNLEMSREQMLSKAISYHLAKDNKAWLSSRDILHGYDWTPDQKDAIGAAMQDYREKYFPWIKYSTAGNKLEEILKYLEEVGEAAKARGEKAPAVILDYLHLIGTTEKMDAQELIKAAVTGLKRYAIKYNTFVILISATNRSSVGRITLNSGRDSSNIEYTGDIVLSLDYYAVDIGNKDAANAKDMAELTDEKKVKWRQMILRVLKGRFFAPGNTARLWYNARCNYYLGENDWIPGRLMDELPEFEENYDQGKVGQRPLKRI